MQPAIIVVDMLKDNLKNSPRIRSIKKEKGLYPTFRHS